MKKSKHAKPQHKPKKVVPFKEPVAAPATPDPEPKAPEPLPFVDTATHDEPVAPPIEPPVTTGEKVFWGVFSGLAVFSLLLVSCHHHH